MLRWHDAASASRHKRATGSVRAQAATVSTSEDLNTGDVIAGVRIRNPFEQYGGSCEVAPIPTV